MSNKKKMLIAIGVACFFALIILTWRLLCSQFCNSLFCKSQPLGGCQVFIDCASHPCKRSGLANPCTEKEIRECEKTETSTICWDGNKCVPVFYQ